MSVCTRGRLLVVVTGASRGIGRTIALELGKQCASGSLFVLLARDKVALDATMVELQQNNPKVTVLTFKTDFSDPNLQRYNSIMDEVLNKPTTQQFDAALCFHNAGTVGTLEHALKLEDVQVWRNYFDLNFVSMSLLNSCFLKSVLGKIPQLYVINITSLCGRVPFEDLTMYGSIKAAREHYCRCLALENKDKVRVLNYSPGPVLTDMYNSIATSADNEAVRNAFMEGKKNCLTTEQTVGKLLGILQEDKFENGSTIDYFD